MLMLALICTYYVVVYVVVCVCNDTVYYNNYITTYLSHFVLMAMHFCSFPCAELLCELGVTFKREVCIDLLYKGIAK